jgi:pimeloyl-ACP methyl ester carboxylesterase
MVGRMADAKRLPLSPFIKGVLRQIADADPRVVRWSIDQVFRFEEVPLDIPVWHIHGDRDPLFPLRYVEPDEVVQGGGHLLPLTHPYEVNNFLRRAIATFGAGDE